MNKKIKSYKADFLIVGVGFSGATFARYAADAGYSVHLIDKRKHIGGNCYSYTDEETGIEIHKYGPHIFHTNSKEIWDFLNKYTTFNNYVNRVKARTNGSIYSLPINLHTINQFFNRTFNPTEAENYIDQIRVKNIPINNFENYILSSIGSELYEAFFKYYTIKQWGIEPNKINISTAKRLPIRFNYNDNYFNDKFQGIPVDGYTKIFNRMLDHQNITVGLETDFMEFKFNWKTKYRKLVFTGAIDQFFDYKFGYLPYRTVSFKEIRGKDIQGNAVINYTDMNNQFTRIHEHKWFTPEKKFENSIAFEEYSDFTNSKKEPYYPIRNSESDLLYNKYLKLARLEKDVIFLGRMAEFRYYDMHQVIGAAIKKFKNYVMG